MVPRARDTLCVANVYTHCHTDSNCNSYDYAYPDAKRHTFRYSDSYRAAESYTNGHIYGYAECYGDSYCYSYRKTDAHCPTTRNTKGAALTSAAALRSDICDRLSVSQQQVKPRTC